MLGLGEDTRVGAPPTPPWVCACTMVATGWVVPNVVLIGLATKPSAKTTPEWKKMCYKQSTTQQSVHRDHYFTVRSVFTRFCFRLWLLLLLLLSDYWCLLYALRGDWCGRVQALHSYGCWLNALRSYRCRLDSLGADLCGWQADPIHCHQLHVVEMDGGGHADSSLSGQCWTWSLRSNLRVKIKLKWDHVFLFNTDIECILSVH